MKRGLRAIGVLLFVIVGVVAVHAQDATKDPSKQSDYVFPTAEERFKK